jgi:hypothetical protein
MRKLLVLITVIALTFAIVTPVFAAGKGPGGQNGSSNGVTTQSTQRSPRGTFAITGTIAEVGTNYVTIMVIKGNKLAQPYIGSQIKLTLTTTTRYLFTDGTTTTTISLADLKVDQSVSVNGLLANDVWTTSRITVGASLSCLL